MAQLLAPSWRRIRLLATVTITEITLSRLPRELRLPLLLLVLLPMLLIILMLWMIIHRCWMYLRLRATLICSMVSFYLTTPQAGMEPIHPLRTQICETDILLLSLCPSLSLRRFILFVIYDCWSQIIILCW